jgi:hypothetical protein
MSVSLEKLISNPFAYRGFKSIWEKRSAEVEEDCLYTLENPELDDNEKFLILNWYDKPIGLTGYYLVDNRIILAWHGIVPDEQGKGYSSLALKRLAEILIAKYPDAKELIELVPQDRETEVGPYFINQGFETVGTIFKHPDFVQDVTWIEYVAPLERLIEKQSHHYGT